MKKSVAQARKSLSQCSSGFTLVELLVVIAVIAVLAAILLPAIARAQQKALAVQCLSNLKQVGLALQLYVEDNAETLPGPVWAGARASYDHHSGTELISYIATYLGAPPPSERTVIAPAFVCPGYLRRAPGLEEGLSSMAGRKVYLLNDDVNASPTNRVPPFGYPELNGSAAIRPLKYSAISGFSSPSRSFAISDLDQALPSLNPSVSWWTDLPNKPVHGAARNKLYFDWHAEAAAW